MKKNAPFLKMYTEYIRNFDQAMKLINQWLEKSTKFSEIIQDIQVLLLSYAVFLFRQLFKLKFGNSSGSLNFLHVVI